MASPFRSIGLAWAVGVVLSLALAAPARAQAPAFDGEATFALLEKQVAFGPRNPGSEGHAKCLDWMLGYLRERADRVVPHGFVLEDPYGEGRLQLTNVHAIFREGAARRVAFAAHWDTRPRADRDSASVADQPILGANDGASGVAVLLQLAEMMHQLPPDIGVDLLLFDGEDYGKEGDLAHYLLGSRRFAQDFPNFQPEAFVLLDMVGDADLSIPMEVYGLRAAPALTQRVFAAAQALGLSAFVPTPGQAVFDDHLPFLQRGIAAIDLIDLDYPAWHTLRDTPEQCSAESLEQVGTLVSHLVWVEFAR